VPTVLAGRMSKTRWFRGSVTMHWKRWPPVFPLNSSNEMASGRRWGFDTGIIFSTRWTPLTEVPVSFATSFMLLRRRSRLMIFSPVRWVKRMYCEKR